MSCPDRVVGRIEQQLSRLHAFLLPDDVHPRRCPFQGLLGLFVGAGAAFQKSCLGLRNGGFDPSDIDVLRTLGGIGEDEHLRGAYLSESARGSDPFDITVLVDHTNSASRKTRDHRRMSGQNTKGTLFAGKLD